VEETNPNRKRNAPEKTEHNKRRKTTQTMEPGQMHKTPQKEQGRHQQPTQKQITKNLNKKTKFKK